MAYTPGVARVCMAVHDDPLRAFNLTIKRNTVAVVSDGTAVLGLGDIGPEAAMPVMEGKAMLFKEFGGVDAFPICLATKDSEEIIAVVKALAPTFGGINLEDISAPRCFKIEDRLKAELDIPVFHDDQHGTAVVVLAALLNALKLVDKPLEDLTVVVSGVGAAGVACSKILLAAGVKNIIGVDRVGAIYRGRSENMNVMKEWYAEHTNPTGLVGPLAQVISGADLFLGVSGPGTLHVEDVKRMADRAIVFAMANPVPEIMPEEAGPYVARDGHRPLGLPEPDQQRAGLPGHLPRRARLPRHRHHRSDEARRRPRHRRGDRRERIASGLHHPLRLQSPRGSRSGHRGLRSRPRRRRGATERRGDARV